MEKRRIIKRLFKKETNNVFVQLFRYTFVGGTAFLVDFGLLYLLTDFVGLYFLISAGIAFSVGLVTNYFLSVVWVFSSRKLSRKSAEFGLFAIIGTVGLGLNEAFMFVFTEEVGLFYLVSKIISAGLVYLWNFFARKYILF